MKQAMVTIFAGLAIGVMSVSATRIVDVDQESMVLSGPLVSVDANGHGTFPDKHENARKYSSITVKEGAITAVIDAKAPRFDFYFNWRTTQLMPNVSYRYAEIHYTVNDMGNGGFTGTANRLRLQAGNKAEDWDDFINPDVINGDVGSHSFIIDLQADKKYLGEWTSLRWDFFNDESNVGKSITVEKVVFAREVIPRTVTLGLISD